MVSDQHIDKFSHASATMYLFLVCVGDDKGLSYYGDQFIMHKLAMDRQTFQNARSNLIENSLIAWQKPIYQVLDLEPVFTHRKHQCGATMSIGDILKGAMEAHYE